MRFRLLVPVLACAVAVSLSTPAFADGDAEKGQRVYTSKCKVCHELKAGAKKIGPSFHGLFGRKAGTVADFKYSDAMAKAGVVWDEKTVAEYMKKPKDFIPGNKMVFDGLPKEDDRENLIKYLKEATK